jgi:cobalt/nickel transport system permease protein
MFVLIIGMAYRYLFLLLASVTDMYKARKARSVGAEKHDAAARRFVFATAGALIGKSLVLSEEVHQAMVSRGYRGNAKVLDQQPLSPSDVAIGAALLLFGITLLIGERLLVR